MIALGALVVLGAVVGMGFEAWRFKRYGRRWIIGSRDALRKLSASQGEP